MKQKIRSWVKRYLPAEILSVIVTLICAWLANKITGNMVVTALAGTWGGNIAYFGYILVSDILESIHLRRLQGRGYTTAAFLRNVRALALEFGIAELVDSFFIRPALMYYLPIWFGNLTLGILIAKLAADVTFYIPAIIGYELRKKYLKDADS